MANICSFNMYVKGDRKNIKNFYNAMCQKGTIYMGRGAEAEIFYEDEENTAFIEGWCKWSVQSALIDNAISMRTEPGKWYFGEGVDPRQFEFITIVEACDRWNLDMEVFSEESGCCFQEHYVVINGELVVDECVDWEEYFIEEYETKEEAERELGIEITDDEWNGADSYITRGGFDNWDFEI